jgi:short-subunit dehydrogenase
MLERDRGAVILVSSINAFAPVGYSAVYTAEKAFELYFGEALWKELKDKKSKVDFLTVCASSTKTNFQARAGTRTAHRGLGAGGGCRRCIEKTGQGAIRYAQLARQGLPACSAFSSEITGGPRCNLGDHVHADETGRGRLNVNV